MGREWDYLPVHKVEWNVCEKLVTGLENCGGFVEAWCGPVGMV